MLKVNKNKYYRRQDMTFKIQNMPKEDRLAIKEMDLLEAGSAQKGQAETLAKKVKEFQQAKIAKTLDKGAKGAEEVEFHKIEESQKAKEQADLIKQFSPKALHNASSAFFPKDNWVKFE